MEAVLILNASFEALGSINWKRAVCLVLDGSAEMIEASGETISSAGGMVFEVPSVVRLTKMVKSIFQRRQPLTKGALRARDGGKCQVAGCNRKGDTVDHLMPRSRGGQHVFENVVLMCRQHNSKKDHYTIEEMGWKLKAPAKVPDFQLLLSAKANPKWENWLLSTTTQTS